MNGESNHRLSDYIIVMRGLVPKEDCDDIINTYQDSNYWEWAKIGDNTNDEVSLDYRKVSQLFMSRDTVKNSSAKYTEVDNKVFGFIKKARDIYINDIMSRKGIKFPPLMNGDEGYILLNYKVGYFYKEHADDQGGHNRVMTCSINLNDQYEGGSFTFFNKEISVDLGVGDAIMFPANFMFPHAVEEITSGERFAIVTWLT